MPHGLLNNRRVRISGNQKIPRKFQIPIELLPSAQPPKAENPASTRKNPQKTVMNPRRSTPSHTKTRAGPKYPTNDPGRPHTDTASPRPAIASPRQAPTHRKRPQAATVAPGRLQTSLAQMALDGRK